MATLRDFVLHRLLQLPGYSTGELLEAYEAAHPDTAPRTRTCGCRIARGERSTEA